MKPSQTIFLNLTDVVNIEGVEMTVSELKEAVIDSHYLRSKKGDEL